MEWLQLRSKPIAVGVVFMVLLTLATYEAMPLLFQVPFLLYALFIYLVLAQGPTNENNHESSLWLTPERYALIVLGASVFFMSLRILPFLRFGEAPLGYDTGFYWRYFTLVTPAGTSLKTLGTSNIAYTPWFIAYHLGISPLVAIHALHLLHQALTLGALYFLARSLPVSKRQRETIGVIVLILAAVSINQYMGYWWMFYKQSAALPFLLFALGFFLRGQWIALPLAAVGAAVHLQTAIPFSIALALYLAIRIVWQLSRTRRIDRETFWLTISAIIGAGLILSLKTKEDIANYFEFIFRYKGLATTGALWEVEHRKGLFIPFATMRLNSLFYLPFATLGFLQQLKLFRSAATEGRMLLFPILVAVLLALSSAPVLYQHRNLIALDSMVLLLAAPVLLTFLIRIRQYAMSQLWLGLLGIGALLFSAGVILNHPPQFTTSEAAELTAVMEMVGSQRPYVYTMATDAMYTPWVYAYTGFEPTIAPGWLTWDLWTYTMWNQFWSTRENVDREAMLAMYKKPIYLFIGDRQQPSLALRRFLRENPRITNISPHVWKFLPFNLDKPSSTHL